MRELKIILTVITICFFTFLTPSNLSAQNQFSCELNIADLEGYEIWEENIIDCWRCEKSGDPVPVYENGVYVGLLYDAVPVYEGTYEVVCFMYLESSFCRQTLITTTSNDECVPIFEPATR